MWDPIAPVIEEWSVVRQMWGSWLEKADRRGLPRPMKPIVSLRLRLRTASVMRMVSSGVA